MLLVCLSAVAKVVFVMLLYLLELLLRLCLYFGLLICVFVLLMFVFVLGARGGLGGAADRVHEGARVPAVPALQLSPGRRNLQPIRSNSPTANHRFGHKTKH